MKLLPEYFHYLAEQERAPQLDGYKGIEPDATLAASAARAEAKRAEEREAELNELGFAALHLQQWPRQVPK